MASDPQSGPATVGSADAVSATGLAPAVATDPATTSATGSSTQSPFGDASSGGRASGDPYRSG